MNSKLLSLCKDSSLYLTNYFPLAFCLAVCLGFDPTVGIIISCLSVLFSPKLTAKEMMSTLISFLIIGIYPEKALGASLICAALLIISSFFSDKLKQFVCSPIASGIAISGALTVTVLFTTDYFGIGATGSYVTEMIKSYISLGFHPNWRGVLYGTIVLVLMITFPRKFKNISKIISAPFTALLLTLILNLFLNPSDMISAINEIPKSEAMQIKEYFITRAELNFDFLSFLIGFSLFVLNFNSIVSVENTKQKDLIACGISNIFSTGFIGLPLPFGINKDKKSFIPRIISAIIILALYFLFDDIICRIPLHSCAVVIIVTAWGSVNWGEIKKCFGKTLPFICFIITVAVCIVTEMLYGLIFSFILCCLLFIFNRIISSSKPAN